MSETQSSQDSPPRPPRRQLAVAAALLSAAALTLLLQTIHWNDAPPDEDRERAAERVAAEAEAGDAFRVEPVWEARPRVHLQPLPYVPAEQATWFDVSPFGTIWILAEAGREADALAHMPPGWSETGRQQFGEIVLLETAPQKPDPTLWDVITDLSEAKVIRKYGSRARVCDTFTDRDAPRWDCQRRDAYLYVGETTQVVTNSYHRCLWAMPIDRGGELLIQFDDVPLGERLVGRYGQPIDAVRSNRGSPVSFSVQIDGRQVHDKTFGLHEEGFQRYEIDTGGAGERGEVIFTVHADSQVDRFFCFTARTIGQ